MILLDTHVWLWLLHDLNQLSSQAQLLKNLIHSLLEVEVPLFKGATSPITKLYGGHLPDSSSAEILTRELHKCQIALHEHSR
jgi:hypothetical protein